MKLLQTKICARWMLVLATFACFNAANAQQKPSTAPFDFKGRLLVALSDADMVASAYDNGNLGSGDGRDTLSILRLDKPSRDLRAVPLGVSNSVTGPPASVIVTPSGKYAIVIEVRGRRPTNKPKPKLNDLPIGRNISVIDLSRPDHPRVVQRLRTFEQPYSVSINSQGTLVAVSFGPLGASKKTPLAFFKFRNGRLSSPLTPSIPGWISGDYLVDVEFYPRANVLALLNFTRKNLSFVQVSAKGAGLSLSFWGNAVGVDKAPFLVRFSPDGRYALANSTTVPGTPRGSVSCVRLATRRTSDGKPEHVLVSRAATGVIPEGLTVSPDGRWVVTTNLERSWTPFDDSRQGFFSSLTLLRLNSQTGQLERVGDFAFDGVLPETAVFDNSSRFLAVTNFDFFDPSRKGGSITFWRIASDYADPKRAELVKMDYAVPVARGAHSMVIVR